MTSVVLTLHVEVRYLTHVVSDTDNDTSITPIFQINAGVYMSVCELGICIVQIQTDFSVKTN